MAPEKRDLDSEFSDQCHHPCNGAIVLAELPPIGDQLSDRNFKNFYLHVHIPLAAAPGSNHSSQRAPRALS
jgi:hypothetical protein